MKKLCFVCYRGYGVSPYISERFKDYLSTKKIKNIDVVHAGIEASLTLDTKKYEKTYIENIRDSDFLVLTLKLPNEDLDKLNNLKPKGEILSLEQIEYEIYGTNDSVFGCLVKKLTI